MNRHDLFSSLRGVTGGLPRSPFDISRTRRIVSTSRRAQTVVAATISLVAGLTVARGLAAAESAADSWAGDVPAFAVKDHIESGDEITLDDLVEVRLPPALVPDGALTEVAPGTRARLSLTARTILVATMVDDAVTYPDDWRVVAFAPGAATLPVSPGDDVDIVAGTDVLVEGAVVASLSPLTIAVPGDLAPVVAAAVRLGEVSLVGR